MDAKHQSRISNGSTMHVGKVDGRSASARRWRDLHDEIAEAAAAAGPASPARAQTVRRAATLALLCETQEAQLARGEAIDASEYTRTAGSLMRTLRALGLTPADAEPQDAGRETLDQYLQRVYGTAEEAPAE